MGKIRLTDFDYSLPKAAIALRPAQPRDAAKLLVYDRNTERVQIDVFRQLGKYLPPRAVLVLNDTKVIPARFEVQKPTGGKVELLWLGRSRSWISVLSNRRLEVGWIVRGPRAVTFRVMKRIGAEYQLRPSVSVEQVNALLERAGKIPLPPYLRHSPLSEADRKRWYQTVFAKRGGSVAAPTASLHFTKSLLARLKQQGVAIEFVTLHVNLGTFAPVTEQHVKQRRLHQEWYEISAAAAARLNRWKREGRPIVAVGTTVARALESATRPSGGRVHRGRLKAGSGTTQIFIQPGYGWKFVDGLITNFHVPKSSLMMLVASLVGRAKLLQLYRLGLGLKFKFFSFGDGMLIR